MRAVTGVCTLTLMCTLVAVRVVRSTMVHRDGFSPSPPRNAQLLDNVAPSLSRAIGERLRRDVTGNADGSSPSHRSSVDCRLLAESCRVLHARPVCGSDGRTYRSKCELKRTRRCQVGNDEISRKSRLVMTARGPCTSTSPALSSSLSTSSSDNVGGSGGRSSTSRCLDERLAALRQFQTTSSHSSEEDLGQTFAAVVTSSTPAGRRPLPPVSSPNGGISSAASGGASGTSESQPYVPECRPDGRYAEFQCHNATSYCWCVAPDTGKPLPGSSVHGRRPTDCADRLRRFNGRPHRATPASAKVVKRRRGVSVGDCTAADRTIFNSNLVKLFTDEYQRAPRSLQQSSVMVKDHPTTSKSNVRSESSNIVPSTGEEGQPVGSSSSAAAPSTVASSSVPSSIGTGGGGGGERRLAVEWKFSELDVDADGRLDRKELRTLRYLVNKLVKPRQCAKTFAVRCDVDMDRRLTGREWVGCFDIGQDDSDATGTVSSARLASISGGRGTSGGYRFPSSSARTPSRSRSHAERLALSSARPLPRPIPRFHPSQLRPSGVTGGSRNAASGGTERSRGASIVSDTGGRLTGNGIGLVTGARPRRLPVGLTASKVPLPSTSADSNSQSFLALINSKVGGRYNRTAGRIDAKQNGETRTSRQHGAGLPLADSEASGLRSTCNEERTRALELDRVDPEGHIFVPECDPNGGGVQFRRAQCHNSTGYCWCVDEHTGIPIPGISTHNATPNCSDVNTRRLKGCPPSAKRRFLTELLDRITQEMVETASNGSMHSRLDEPDPDQSIEERAVRWKLSSMDTNNNNVLEKSELRQFKEDMKVARASDEKFARKCRRNFLQYCDDDGDSRITIDEWVACTGLNDQPKHLPENPKRRGPNPFSTVLKS